MKSHTPMKSHALAAAAALAAFAATPAQADWVTLATTGTPTLTVCNPKINIDTPQETQSATVTTCKVDGLPGSAAIPGYIQRASRTANITLNSKVVGTLHDRVWCRGTGTTCDATNTYILGARILLNTTAWNPSGLSFEVNDLMRAVRPATSLDIAYFMGTNDTAAQTPDNALAKKYVEYSGRTLQGLFEPSTSAQTNLNKTRNNAWVDFRADINANDPDSNPPFSVSSKWSPWLLVRQVCPTGFNPTPQNLKIRLWEGGEEGQAPQPILTAGYVCN